MSGPGFNYLACGCAHCREELTSAFCKIVHSSFTVAEEKNLELLAERLNIRLRQETLAERIAAYSERYNGPLPDCTA